jgi:hypothetical protein
VIRSANRRLPLRTWTTLLWLLALAIAPPVHAQVPGDCEMPVAQRARPEGCYLVVSVPLPPLPRGPLYWHLYNYPTTEAAKAAGGPHGTVVRSFGRIWLYVIAPQAWHPLSGRRIAVIGPLPIDSTRHYTARYMEAVTTLGMQSRVHRHSGPEAWYLVAGAQCLETPEGITKARAGHTALVPGGPPMLLTSISDTPRRAVVLVLHDSAKPWMETASDWQPQRLCSP